MHDGLRIEVLVPGADLSLAGRLDARTAPLVRAALHAAVADGEGDLIVRIDELEIWDAVGVEVFVGAHGAARRHDRRLVLINVPPRQVRLLKSTRVGRVLAVQPLVA